jgi:hypothetical protein
METVCDDNVDEDEDGDTDCDDSDCAGVGNCPLAEICTGGADGFITERLRNHTAGVLITEINTREKYYDASEAWRDRAMNGVLHSGKLVSDPRSHDRRSH